MKTLPVRLLRHRARLLLPEGVSPWREAEGVQMLALERVHVQRGRGMELVDGRFPDMDVQPSAQLWYDVRLSKPAGMDWVDLQRRAEKLGAQLHIEHDGVEYRVMRMEELRDDFGRVHHVRLELV